MKKENWIKEHPILSGVIGVILLFILIGIFSGGDNNNSTSYTKSTSDTKTAVEKMTALEQMEIAFIGGYSYNEIKERIDSVMQQYGLSKTNENYSRFGSVLVTLRKDYGVSEMDILTCMKFADYKNSVGGEITPKDAIVESASICAITLKS